MKLKNQILPLAISTLLAFGFTSCSDDDDSNDGGGEMETTLTVTDFLMSDAASDFSTLLAAVEYAGLDGALDDANANYTVFAPNNAAFTAWLDGAALTDFTPDEVAQVLLNHVIGTELNAATVTSAVPTYQSTLATGPADLADASTNISIYIDADLEVNGQSTITGPDAYDASNGIIHAVDTVIDLPNITTFVAADATLTTLLAALGANSLVNTIAGLDPATVFAPSDAAFTAGGYELSDATSSVLTYHVISGVNVTAADAAGLADTNSPATVQTQTINILAGPTFLGNGNAADDIASVTTANIQAVNGIIHIIDTVLLPGAETITAAK